MLTNDDADSYSHIIEFIDVIVCLLMLINYPLLDDGINIDYMFHRHELMDMNGKPLDNLIYG